jgi:uncharacterized protein (TIGR00645 family)
VNRKGDARVFYSKIEALLFVFRLALVPMAIGLSFGIAFVVYKFAEQVVEIVQHLSAADPISDAEFMIDVLRLVDFFLIAGLLTMVMISGYENFVEKINIKKHKDGPAWIGRISHHELKLNLSLTVVAISMIQLLQFLLAIMEADDVDNGPILQYVPWLLGLHVAFLVTAFVLAIISRMNEHAPRPPAEAGRPQAAEAEVRAR